jgi:hypothetical protein
MTSTLLEADVATVIPGLATGYLGDPATGFRRAGTPIRKVAKAVSPRPSKTC